MLGYDRPLKPEWIYNTLASITPGTKPEEFYQSYINLATERVGKDGIRKTRTVLFRTFIYSFQEKTSIVENNILMDLCRKHDLEYMKPILISKFMMDYEIIRFLTKKLSQIFDPTQDITTTVLIKKMVEEYGDLEIVKRSTRAFLRTLADFKLLVPIDIAKFRQVSRTFLKPEQVKDIILLYAIVHKTKQIGVHSLDSSLFAFYQKPDIQAVASEYHTQCWDYIRSVNREILTIKL
jgi:hypothetical protein